MAIFAISGSDRCSIGVYVTHIPIGGVSAIDSMALIVSLCSDTDLGVLLAVDISVVVGLYGVVDVAADSTPNLI